MEADTIVQLYTAQKQNTSYASLPPFGRRYAPLPRLEGTELGRLLVQWMVQCNTLEETQLENANRKRVRERNPPAHLRAEPDITSLHALQKHPRYHHAWTGVR